MGDKVNLVNPAYETAIELKNLLERDNLANKCELTVHQACIDSM